MSYVVGGGLSDCWGFRFNTLGFLPYNMKGLKVTVVVTGAI